MIDFLDFHKAYGRHEVLTIPKLKIPDGIHWIKGVNGSGKSTLLKSIAGIIPFKGDILVQGVSIKRSPVKSRRLVTYSEAEPAFPVFLTAGDILDFVAETRKYGPVKMNKLKDHFGINHYQDQAIGGYSAGMLKKLSLCTAFCGEVPWILLDEPFAFIDSATEEILIDLIRQKVEEGINFIITSHHELEKNLFEFNKIFSIKETQLQIEE